MAYMNFAQLDAPPAQVSALPTPASARQPQTGFTALQWQVVAIAQKDRLSSLSEPGRISVALGTVFGGKRPNPRLADPQLEALRRLAVLAWHRGYALPPAELRNFHEAGFTVAQLETLLASIGRGRAALNQGTRA